MNYFTDVSLVVSFSLFLCFAKYFPVSHISERVLKYFYDLLIVFEWLFNVTEPWATMVCDKELEHISFVNYQKRTRFSCVCIRKFFSYQLSKLLISNDSKRVKCIKTLQLKISHLYFSRMKKLAWLPANKSILLEGIVA